MSEEKYLLLTYCGLDTLLYLSCTLVLVMNLFCGEEISSSAQNLRLSTNPVGSSIQGSEDMVLLGFFGAGSPLA